MFLATRRSLVPPSDVKGVMPDSSGPAGPRGHQQSRGRQILALYDRALPEVYGYLLHRCGDTTVAEDLTSETFLAAVRADDAAPVSMPWLIGVARHKLADHWRKRSRDERVLVAIGEVDEMDDPWDSHLNELRAMDVLRSLGEHHRLALTLRYVDGLPVPQVASMMDRTVRATEALLVRARGAFRRSYEAGEDDAD
jgi:RNA polymerase sigma-70 factor, ECF subfamily